MKVTIGPYRDYLSVYQVLRFFKVPEKTAINISERYPIKPLFDWLNKDRGQKVKVRLDKYDTWSMDSTLGYIILPMLKQLQATKHGAPNTEDSDVPEHLRSDKADKKENDWDTDSNHFLRWDYILDEMIWAFEQQNSNWEDQFHTGVRDSNMVEVQSDCIDPDTGKKESLWEFKEGPNNTHVFDQIGYYAWAARMKNGYRLFGMYYQNLWD